MPMQILVNGLPGNVAQQVVAVAKERNIELVPFSFTGPDTAETEISIEGQTFRLLKPQEREELVQWDGFEPSRLVVVDYTHPTAVNDNARYYAARRWPFVMGTTGGDRDLLVEEMDNAGVFCVIAPNMAKQIVAFQAMMEYMGENFPGVFKGWELEVEESHQKTKADTSGTAKAVVASMQKMGLQYSEEDIRKVREEEEQMEWMGVPAEHLGGHAFHTYNIDSADGLVHFEFQHNICGRRIYAEGTIDACEFLYERVKHDESKKRYNMVDLLRAGGLH